MPSTHAPSTRAALEEIVSISSAFGFPAVPIDTMAPSNCDTELCFPPPSPLHSALSALGLHPSLVSDLSRAFEAFAFRLRQTSETKWRHAISACQRINGYFGVSAFDSHFVRVAAVRIYLQELEKMTAKVIMLSRRHMAQFRHDSSANIPRGMPSAISQAFLQKTSRNARCPSSTKGFARPFSSVGSYTSQRESIKSRSNAQKRGQCDLRATMAPSDSSSSVMKRSDIVPVYKLHSVIEEEATDARDLFNVGRTVHAFPVRYTHPEKTPTPAFTSSTKDFSLHTHSTGGSRPSGEDDPSRMSVVFAKFRNFQLENSSKTMEVTSSADQPTVTECSVTALAVQGRPASSIAQSVASPHNSIGVGHNASRVSLDLSSMSVVPKRSKRKVAPLPKRSSSAGSQEGRHSLQLCSFAPSPSTTSASTGQPASLAGDGSSNAPLTPATSRHRKVAPLPHRQPATLARCRPSLTSLAISDSHSSSASSTRKLFPTISRTPSLVSLASSRSGSPVASDDGLSTPPPSPRSKAADATSPVAFYKAYHSGAPGSSEEFFSSVFGVTVKQETAFDLFNHPNLSF